MPDDPTLSSLHTAAARNLATTTKSAPQMGGVSPRWLLRMLPWVETKGGVYRVNRRLRYDVGDGRVSFVSSGSDFEVIPEQLPEIPLLREFDDLAVLTTLAGLFVQQELAPGEVLFEAGASMDQLVLLAHGRANEIGVSEFGEPMVLRRAGEGDYFGERLFVQVEDTWGYRVEALTTCVVLTVARDVLWGAINDSSALQAHIEARLALELLPQDRHHQAEIALSAGHTGEVELPRTFVDYELAPREYELSVAQTVLRVHSRVADLYNEPMNQLEHQLRLTIEGLRERQEHELINNSEFGLLHNIDYRQRVFAEPGPPTPDDLDELLCRRKRSQFMLAHPRAISAFSRECSHRRIAPRTVEVSGQAMLAWRNIPILPCDKIPISDTGTTSFLCLRTGLDREGVVGLHQTGIPDEIEPSLNARFMGIDEKAVISYLVSAYYSVAVLVPDALGVLEGVQLGLGSGSE